MTRHTTKLKAKQQIRKRILATSVKDNIQNVERISADQKEK